MAALLAGLLLATGLFGCGLQLRRQRQRKDDGGRRE